jgi:hypothetical protein
MLRDCGKSGSCGAPVMKTVRRLPSLFVVGRACVSIVIALISILAWHSSDDFKQWQQTVTSHDDVSLKCSWFSKRGDLSLLEWDNMPLTPDFQSRQKLDKILEVVQFAFEKDLSPGERKAFEYRIYVFIR